MNFLSKFQNQSLIEKIRLKRNVISDLYSFLEKIYPLTYTGKLEGILIQLSHRFTIASFSIRQEFLDKLPRKPEKNYINNPSDYNKKEGIQEEK